MDNLVSIIIPSYGIEEVLSQCLDSLKANTQYPNYEVILIDDSGDPHKKLEHYLKPFAKHELIKHNSNKGFPISVNDGIKHSSGKYLFVSNDDFIYTNKDWLGSSVKMAEKEQEAGIIGWKLLLPNGTLQTTGGMMGTGPVGVGESPSKYNKSDLRDFSNGLIKRELIKKIGYFDEAFSPGYYEDMDLCCRARKAGYTIIYNPDCVISHAKSSTMSKLRDGRFLYRISKNKLRFMLLNYSFHDFLHSWASKSPKKTTEAQKRLKRESVGGAGTMQRIFSYTKAIIVNIINLPDIVYLRMNRTKFLD